MRTCRCSRSPPRQVWSGEGVRSHHRGRLRRFGIRGRVNHRHARGAGLSRHGVAFGRFAIQRQAQNLAQRLVGILGRRHALPVPDTKK